MTIPEIQAKTAEYLQSGGLFNPECMEHDKVRDLLIEISATKTIEIGYS